MRVVLLTDRRDVDSILPALCVVADEIVTQAVHESSSIPDADAVLLDATGDLFGAVTACRTVTGRTHRPVVLILGDGALAVVKHTWGFADWVLPRCSIPELRTRLRLLTEQAPPDIPLPRSSPLEIDLDRYEVRVHGQVLDLTFREFELLRALWSRPRSVWTRQRLLFEVWDYPDAGAESRTVDVHIRRLRAKLGPEVAATIRTVRGVGYKLEPPSPDHPAVTSSAVTRS